MIKTESEVNLLLDASGEDLSSNGLSEEMDDMSQSSSTPSSSNSEGGLPGKAEKPPKFPYHWMLLALLSHTGWGIYPVLARYLQHVGGLPPMSLLATGNGLVSIIAFVIILRKGRFMTVIRLKILPLLVLVTIIRATTNLLSTKFTLAIYVQLVTLMSPFVVAAINKFILKEPLPPLTIPALLLCTIGAVMILLSSIFPFRFTTTPMDWIGIALASVAACFLALYMVLVKKATGQASGEELLFFVTFPLVIVGLVASLIAREDWTGYLHMDLWTWLAWLAFSGVILLFGNIIQISSIRYLGAPMVSTLLPTRLISSVISSVIILGESPSSAFQLLGVCVVTLTLTVYLCSQRKK